MNLSDWRKTANMTQEALEAALGCSRAHLSKVERGLAVPSPDLARRIEALTRGAVTAASLLGVETPPTPQKVTARKALREEAATFDASRGIRREQTSLSFEVTLASAELETLSRLGVDIEAVAREGAASALRAAYLAAWAEANRDAIGAYNAWIDENGTLSEELGLI